MALRISLPFGDKEGVKDLVFGILTKEYPLKIIELTNFIRKRYGKSVTFQAVRKAVLRLVEEGVLIKTGNEFSINKKWVIECKKILDDLYLELQKGKVTPKNIESIKGEVSVFTFDSVNEMMKFWQELIDDWFANFKRGDPKINCYQAAHTWEGLLHPDKERALMGQLKKKGIVSYILSTGRTPLDRGIVKLYRSIGVEMRIVPSSASFDRSYHVGTYGDMVVQTRYPPGLVNDLEAFFKTNKTLEDLDLGELSEIVNKRTEIKLTVIKNLDIAKKINESIISRIE